LTFSGDTNTGIFSPAADTIAFSEGGVESMRIDSAGNLLVGTTASPEKLTVAGGIASTATYSLPAGTSALTLGYDSGSNVANITSLTSGTAYRDLRILANNTLFLQGGTERARITSGGYFKASDNGVYNNATASYHEFRNTANSHTVYIKAASASQAVASLLIDADRNTTNGTFYAIEYYNSGAAASKFRVADSGNVTNTNGSYGTIPSERRFKQDIVDAPSQWDDIKNIRLRKYRMKSDVEQNGEDALTQLGVIIDELEPVCPGLVEEHPVYEDRDIEDENGNVTTEKVLIDTVKGWKTSIVHLKALKALQEAMDRIEKLEAEVALLKGAA
jgi:hypothetical protein